jgi:phenylacetate-CoA ligase
VKRASRPDDEALVTIWYWAYSAQEVGAIALQCPGSALYHVHAGSLIVEALAADGRACAAGETGRVVVTDLHNFATPLIRHELGAYAEVGPPCPCGRALPTLARVLGRQRNMVVLPNGQRYWPLVGLHRFREVGQLLQYQVVQQELEQVELRLVVGGGEAGARLDRAAETRLDEIVQHALGHPFQIRFSYMAGALPRSGAFGRVRDRAASSKSSCAASETERANPPKNALP